MNKKKLQTIGTSLFAFWFFVMGMQLTFVLLNFDLLNIILYIAEATICVLLIKILDLKTIIWNKEREDKDENH